MWKAPHLVTQRTEENIQGSFQRIADQRRGRERTDREGISITILNGRK